MSDLADWLTLWRAPGIGPATFEALVRHFGSPGTALRAGRSELKHAGLVEAAIAGILQPNAQGVERDLTWAAQPDHQILRSCDPEYPSRLREIASAPPVLFVSGDLACLSDPQIAIVGSRHPTPGGRKNAFAFADHLARAGLTITSGLAMGIDGTSHEGALAGEGYTIAVAATGPDRIYPARHRELARRIVERGAIISEFPTGAPPKAEHFPRRNRLISGLSLGVLVVEAARRSGSLITARFAAEQGREVFAIPGSIQNPLAKGCHQLIRLGAKLVETADDILEEIAKQIELKRPSMPAAGEPAEIVLDKEYQLLLDYLGYDPTPVDELVERSGLTVDSVSSMLLILELKGLVAAGAGGLYVRLAPGNTQ
jgi:DNA processing protein